MAVRRQRSIEVRISEKEEQLDRLKLQKAIKDMRDKVKTRRRRRR